MFFDFQHFPDIDEELVNLALLRAQLWLKIRDFKKSPASLKLAKVSSS